MSDRYKISKIIFLFLIVLSTSLAFSGCSNNILPELKDELFSEYRNQVNKGNQLYKTEDFDNASKAYHNAELEAPESPVVNNNIGSVFYKQDNFEKSEEYYRKAIDQSHSNKQHLQQAHYNLGNALFKQDKLEESILEYKTALDLDPDDVEAKFNLEFARIKLKEKIQEQQKQQKQCDNNQNKNDEKDEEMDKHRLPDDKKKEENPNCQNKKESQQQTDKKEDKQARAGNNEKKEQEEKKEQGAKEDKKENEISKEEALRILRSLDDKEKNKNKDRSIQIPAGDYVPDKDW